MNAKQLKRITLSPLSIFRENRAGRTSSLKYNLNNGYPRIVVFINGADRSVSGMDNMIIAPFTFYNLNLFLGAVAAITEDPNDTTYEINCYNTKWDNDNNKRTDDVELVAVITVGKDNNGIIYLAVKSEGKPNVRFNLTATHKWNTLIKNGLDITLAAEGSKLFTKRYLKQLEKAFDELLKESNEVYVPENKI